jgi:predicted alpha/beta hydrolase
MSDLEIVFSVVKSPQGGYEAQALGHSIRSQAESMKELHSALRDAVSCHFGEGARPVTQLRLC